MLARPEWYEPEKREPMYSRSPEVSMGKAFAAALVASICVWAFLILPFLGWLNKMSVAHYAARYTFN